MIERLFIVLLALGLIYLVVHYTGAFFEQLVRLSRTNKPYSCLYLHKTVALEMECLKNIESDDALEHVRGCRKTRQRELNAITEFMEAKEKKAALEYYEEVQKAQQAHYFDGEILN